MDITCYRDPEVASESRTLPADVYNLARILLHRNPGGSLFVPLRSMQYLAILDAEEFVFVDGFRKCWVDIAWRRFQPQRRTGLDDAVAYEAVYYRAESPELMPRLQAEFPLALRQLADKAKLEGEARVIPFPPSR